MFYCKWESAEPQVGCLSPDNKHRCVSNENDQFEAYWEIEGGSESAYLRQVNFYRRPLLEKFLRGHAWIVPGNMYVKFEVRSLNRFGAISI